MLRTLSSGERAVTALGVARAVSMASVMCVLSSSARPVVPGLVPGIHVLQHLRERSRGWPGHRRAEATPSFGRLCPAMTPVRSVLPPQPFGLARQIDGLHFLELDAAILDEIVQWRIGRTRD